MSESVWATPDASAKSVAQARRRHPSTFAEEPASKKRKFKCQDKTEGTKQEVSKRIESQSSPLALVPRFAHNVPQMHIPEFIFLPAHPSPALDFDAHQICFQSVMRFLEQSHANEEDAESTLEEYLARLYPTHSEKGKIVTDICVNSIILQEGLSVIYSYPHSRGKLCALMIAFGLLNRLVGDKHTRGRTLLKANFYCVAVTGYSSHWSGRLMMLATEFMKSDIERTPQRMHAVLLNLEEDLFLKLSDDIPEILYETGDLLITYIRLVNEAKAWESQNPGAIKQFGEVF